MISEEVLSKRQAKGRVGEGLGQQGRQVTLLAVGFNVVMAAGGPPVPLPVSLLFPCSLSSASCRSRRALFHALCGDAPGKLGHQCNSERPTQEGPLAWGGCSRDACRARNAQASQSPPGFPFTILEWQSRPGVWGFKGGCDFRGRTPTSCQKTLADEAVFGPTLQDTWETTGHL